MAFDVNQFYADLDDFYGKYDNAATEQFLLDSLAKSEEYMIIPTSCSSCQDHSDHTPEENYERLTDAEKKWILECSDARIAVLNEMACFYRGTSNWNKCISAFDAVIDELTIRGLEKTNQYAVVLLNEAGAFRLMGEFDKALATFAKAEEILTSNGDADPYELAGLYNNTGLVYQDMGKLDKAIENFELALDYLAKADDTEAEIATNSANLAIAYYSSGNLNKALDCLNRSIAIFEKLDDGMNPHYAGALNTKAVVLFNNGDFAGAAATFADAAAKTKLIFGENKDYATLCRNTAYAYAKLGDNAQAAEYSAIADEVAKKIG